MFKIQGTLLVLLVFSFVSHSSEILLIAAGVDKPPYVIQKNNSGFEIELLEQVFYLMGKSVKFDYLSYGGGAKILDIEGLEAVSSTTEQIYTDTSMLSDVYIEYQNVAIALAENNFEMSQISDLSKYSIISFPLSDKVLALNSPLR